MGSPAELITRAVGLRQTTPEILAASAQVSRRLLGADSTFADIADTADNYPMLITDGIRDARFREITVRPGAGLGGQVLLRGRPHSVADYARDPTSAGILPMPSATWRGYAGWPACRSMSPIRMGAWPGELARSVRQPLRRMVGSHDG